MPKAKSCIIALLGLVVIVASAIAIFITVVYQTGGSNSTVADNLGKDNATLVNKTCNGNETVNDIFRHQLGCDALKNISDYENGTSIAKDMFKTFFVMAYTIKQTNHNDSRERRETDGPTLSKQFKDRSRLVDVLKESLKTKKDIVEFKNLLNNPKVNPDVNIDFISEKVWERTGAKIVEKLIKGIGMPAHSLAAGYIGGTAGIALAAIFPTGTITLVVGGVFIGRGLGAQLGDFNSKLVSDFVNERLLKHAIKPLVKEHFREELILLIDKIRESPATLCRSDVCPIGYVEKACQCVKCDGPMDYSDRKGLSKCKSCSQGSIPLRSSVTSVINDSVILRNDQIQIGCDPCPRDHYGKKDGRCFKCDKPLQYSRGGATKCQECAEGSYPRWLNVYFYCMKYRCTTYDDQCHACSKNLYSHEGSDKCIQCPPNQVSFRLIWNTCQERWYGCRYCPFYGVKNVNGDCVRCDGTMEYNDVKGARKCKKCPQGKRPNAARNMCLPL